MFALADLSLPIVGAPMAGGPSTPALAAAVSDAGGVGFLAAGYKTADAVAEQIDALRATTSAPFGLNLFLVDPYEPDRDALDAMIARLKGALVPGQVYAPAQLRDVLGSSRKYLIPFLEFCDRSGVTERRGDGRVLRETPGIRLDTSHTES